MVTAMPLGYIISEREWERDLSLVSSSILTTAKKKKNHSKKVKKE